MEIQEMRATFGKLQDQTLSLKPGLNCIYAPNESGKSTWGHFLRIMLYGLSTRERGDLADKNRFALLPEIVRQFRLLELRDSGEGLCVFRCAREPDDESLRSLAKLLCARHSYCAVTFEIVQDNTLLGGFTAEIDGVTYDKSVRGQLRALAHDL